MAVISLLVCHFKFLVLILMNLFLSFFLINLLLKGMFGSSALSASINTYEVVWELGEPIETAYDMCISYF